MSAHRLQLPRLVLHVLLSRHGRHPCLNNTLGNHGEVLRSDKRSGLLQRIVRPLFTEAQVEQGTYDARVGPRYALSAKEHVDAGKQLLQIAQDVMGYHERPLAAIQPYAYLLN